ncbi:MAG: hypothetical protein ACC646_12765, partial [Paracoccaceae bacterium]
FVAASACEIQAKCGARAALGGVFTYRTALARAENCLQRDEFDRSDLLIGRANSRVAGNFRRVPSGFRQNPPLRRQFRLKGRHPVGAKLTCTGGFCLKPVRRGK